MNDTAKKKLQKLCRNTKKLVPVKSYRKGLVFLVAKKLKNIKVNLLS